MNYTFEETDIQRQVLDFMLRCGIIPKDTNYVVRPDGLLHRFPVDGDKHSERSGAYCIYGNNPGEWPAGWVQDWRKGIKLNWKFEASSQLSEKEKSYFKSDEYRKLAEERYRKEEEQREAKRLEMSERARILFEALPEANEHHSYLTRKKVHSFDLKYNVQSDCLAVPLRTFENRIMSIQWIPNDTRKHKSFYEGASLKGAFWSSGLDDTNVSIVLLGEGFATMAKIRELTGYPCVAAMSCSRLKEVATVIHHNLPESKIIIMADNDWETERTRKSNPGIREAQYVVQQKFALDFITPEFSPDDIDCSDWDDFAIRYGDEKTKEILQEKINWACLSENQRFEVIARNKISKFTLHLNPDVKLPPQEFIGGLFPRGFVSLLFAPPGTGKTIFMQKFVSDLSIGGNIFDGFAIDEPVRKSLILAGEAGYELLARRANSMKLKINPEYVLIFDQYEAETNDVPISFNSKEGWANVTRLVDIHKPDIIFVDTFSSFHEKDENKASEMKPIINKLISLAKAYKVAVVLIHHSRKRAAKERSLSLDQNDVIGSSILNRLAGLIIGIEPTKDDEKVLLVKPLKSWFFHFMPFSYSMKENINGETLFNVDLAPTCVNNSKLAVWMYIQANFKPGEWFSRSQIVLSEIKGSITERQLRYILSEYVKQDKLKIRGSKKGQEYTIR